MPLHPEFPTSPYAVLEPKMRWRPEGFHWGEGASDKLIPPLVYECRRQVHQWRDQGYPGVTVLTQALLSWWFEEEHPLGGGRFRYYFAQREAVETVIYLLECVGIKDRYDMLRLDSSGGLNANSFPEVWKRLCVKMATGSGKTKVLSLILTWCYFKAWYENSPLGSKNILLVAPNVIVLERLRADFDGLKLFREDPVLPPDGYGGYCWHADFQPKVHVQDAVGSVSTLGNIFLSNIQRLYKREEVEPTLEDPNTEAYFLGKKPKTSLYGPQTGQLRAVLEDLEDMVILNDEAHHIHDPKLAWYRVIKELHGAVSSSSQAGSVRLQLDVTATPKDGSGNCFPCVVSDYALVEAIYQNVVKHPILPDAASRAKLKEYEMPGYPERYRDYLDLGVLQWRKAYAEHEKKGKKAILFVMTDNTQSCDEVSSWLQERYPDLRGAVLTIHTNAKGDIEEGPSSKASSDELSLLREQAKRVDSPQSPYRVIVSVLMLKEGWDVNNVVTIVGLRPYTADSGILPEQTLGRGLRMMYRGGQGLQEELVVVGSAAFMEFVESIRGEGVILEYRPMDESTPACGPKVICIEPGRDKALLDLEIPQLVQQERVRAPVDLDAIDPEYFGWEPIRLEAAEPESVRTITFKDVISDQAKYTTDLAPYMLEGSRSFIESLCERLMHKHGLFSGYDALYGKLKQFLKKKAFGEEVDLDAPLILEHLTRPLVFGEIFEAWSQAIGMQLATPAEEAMGIKPFLLSEVGAFALNAEAFFVPKKSLQSVIVGDSHFELEFARWLDTCPDTTIVSFARVYPQMGFYVPYVDENGRSRRYYPDFFVKTLEGTLWILELKGRETTRDTLKLRALKHWCEQVNTLLGESKVQSLYILQEAFEAQRPQNWAHLFAQCARYA